MTDDVLGNTGVTGKRKRRRRGPLTKPRRLKLGPMGINRLEALPADPEARAFIVKIRTDLIQKLGRQPTAPELLVIVNAAHGEWLLSMMRAGHCTRGGADADELVDWRATTKTQLDNWKLLGIKPDAPPPGPDHMKLIEAWQEPVGESQIRADDPAATTPAETEPTGSAGHGE